MLKVSGTAAAGSASLRFQKCAASSVRARWISRCFNTAEAP